MKKTNQTNQTLPAIADHDCELKVIGTLLSYSKSINDVRPILTDDCFSHPRNRIIYEAIRGVDADGDTVDIISVMAKLAKKGNNLPPAEVLETTCHSTASDLVYYACRLKELATRRRLWHLGQKLIAAGVTEVDDLDQVIEQTNSCLSFIYDTPDSVTVDLREVYDRQLLPQMIANSLTDGSLKGSPTGFPEIDRRGGLCPCDLIVVAGESSHGKTSLATAFMLSAAQEGHDVAVYSMEMTSAQITARIASMQTGISSLSITQGMLQRERIDSITRAMQPLALERLHFDDRATSSIDNILSSIRSMKIKYDIKGAVIDYLQILNVNRSSSSNKEQAMADAARRLKNLAKELDIWIVALSQLSRDRDRPQPDISRLRDSGQIAEAADIVILVYRPELHGDTRGYGGQYSSVSTSGTALINIAKGRNIGTFSFICGFDASRTLFYPLDKLPGRTADADAHPAEKFKTPAPF